MRVEPLLPDEARAWSREEFSRAAWASPCVVGGAGVRRRCVASCCAMLRQRRGNASPLSRGPCLPRRPSPRGTHNTTTRYRENPTTHGPRRPGRHGGRRPQRYRGGLAGPAPRPARRAPEALPSCPGTCFTRCSPAPLSPFAPRLTPLGNLGPGLDGARGGRSPALATRSPPNGGRPLASRHPRESAGPSDHGRRRDWPLLPSSAWAAELEVRLPPRGIALTVRKAAAFGGQGGARRVRRRERWWCKCAHRLAARASRPASACLSAQFAGVTSTTSRHRCGGASA